MSEQPCKRCPAGRQRRAWSAGGRRDWRRSAVARPDQEGRSSPAAARASGAAAEQDAGRALWKHLGSSLVFRRFWAMSAVVASGTLHSELTDPLNPNPLWTRRELRPGLQLLHARVAGLLRSGQGAVLRAGQVATGLRSRRPRRATRTLQRRARNPGAPTRAKGPCQCSAARSVSALWSERQGRSTKLNVVPRPGRLSTPIVEPMASTRCLTIDRPSPVPPSSRERPASTR